MNVTTVNHCRIQDRGGISADEGTRLTHESSGRAHRYRTLVKAFDALAKSPDSPTHIHAYLRYPLRSGTLPRHYDFPGLPYQAAAMGSYVPTLNRVRQERICFTLHGSNLVCPVDPLYSH
jgi:hypothetical protein